MFESNLLPRRGRTVVVAAAILALVGAVDAASARPIRGGAVTSVHGGGGVNRNANFNRNTNINVNRDVNVNVDNHWDRGGCCYHPVATGIAIGATAAITAAAIGSMAYSLPPACVTSGIYYHCGAVWYQPRYEGTSVTYIVVNHP